MTQTYKIFTTYTTMEEKNKYFQECVDKEIVNLVVTAKRKYALVEWDLITLDNARQMRKDDQNCSLGDDIKALYESYIKRVNFSKSQLSYQIHNASGIIYIYKSDIEDILPKICTLIDNMINSDCIEFTTAEEKFNDLPENLKKYIGNKNLGFK